MTAPPESDRKFKVLALLFGQRTRCFGRGTPFRLRCAPKMWSMAASVPCFVGAGGPIMASWDGFTAFRAPC
jgi:hypothetical protein